MKSSHFVLFVVLSVIGLFGYSGCKKDISGCTDPLGSNYNPDATVDNGTCTYSGKVSFWQSGNPSYSTTKVIIDGGNNNQITVASPSGVTGCETVGCANFTLSLGTHTFIAEELQDSAGTNWSGTFEITANGCLTYKLP